MAGPWRSEDLGRRLLRVVLDGLRILRRDLVPFHFIGRQEAYIHLHAGVIAATEKVGELAALNPEAARIAAENRRVHRRLIEEFENRARVHFHRVHCSPWSSRRHKPVDG